MTAGAGGKVYASDINTRVATATPVTADSAAFSAGAESGTLMSVTATLVAGRRYHVEFRGGISSGVAADCYIVRIYDTSSAGTRLAQVQVYVDTTSTIGFLAVVHTEVVAAATGSKTYVVTAQRNDGTGSGQLRAAADRPATMWIDLINEA